MGEKKDISGTEGNIQFSLMFCVWLLVAVRVPPANYSQNYPWVKCISRGLAVDLFLSPLYSFMFCSKEEMLFSLVPLLY